MAKYRVEFHGPSYLKTFVEAASADEAEKKGWEALAHDDFEVCVVRNADGVVDGFIDCDGAFRLDENGNDVVEDDAEAA